MEYKEIKGDLFTVGSEYSLVQCISADFEMGKGIAVEFNKRFDMKNRLIKNFGALRYRVDTVGKALYQDGVFNLVTKVKYFNKPTYQTLRWTLEDMKRQCIDREIRFIALPLIGSGLDKLQWSKVSKVLQEVFKDTDCDLIVYKLK